MEQKIKQEILRSVQDFKLPQYEQIPDVGLYLEQTTKYISEYLQPLDKISITGSMVSNYVKKGLIKNPVKKQYNREQIAFLIFIAVAKTVLSLEDIQLLIDLGIASYSPQKAYGYFCREFENVLHFVFGLKDTLDEVGSENTDEKVMLRNTIITLAYKIYLDKCFAALQGMKGGQGGEVKKEA